MKYQYVQLMVSSFCALALSSCDSNTSSPEPYSLYAAEADLKSAVQSGDLNQVKHALKNGVDVNEKLQFGTTALAYAVNLQDRDIVKYLLTNGADPDIADDDGATPLIVACELGDENIVLQLLNAGANAAHAQRDSISAFSLCAGNSSIETIEAMLASVPDVDARDDRGLTPLMWAASSGNTDILALLIEQNADVNAISKSNFTPLFFAIKSQNIDAVKLLINAGADASHIGPKGTSAIQLAVYQKNFDAVYHLLDFQPDIRSLDRHGRSLLHAAALNGAVDVIEKLVNMGVDVEQLTGPSTLTYRTEANFGIPPAELPPIPALFLAAENGQSDAMRALIKAGADVNFKDKNGRTLLHAAVNSISPEAVNTALEYITNPNVTMADGTTALQLLLQGANWTDVDEKGLEKTLILFSKAGANADIANSRGTSAHDTGMKSITWVKKAYTDTYLAS